MNERNDSPHRIPSVSCPNCGLGLMDCECNRVIPPGGGVAIAVAVALIVVVVVVVVLIFA